MRKILIQLVKCFFKNELNTQINSISTKDFLCRDIQNCLTNQDIKTFIEVLDYCKNDLSVPDLIHVYCELGYKKEIIKYCDKHLTNNRYTDHQIRSMIKNANSIAKVDAIVLHLNRNAEYYTSDFYTEDFDKILAKKDLTVFQVMAQKRINSLRKKYKV